MVEDDARRRREVNHTFSLVLKVNHTSSIGADGSTGPCRAPVGEMSSSQWARTGMSSSQWARTAGIYVGAMLFGTLE